MSLYTRLSVFLSVSFLVLILPFFVTPHIHRSIPSHSPPVSFLGFSLLTMSLPHTPMLALPLFCISPPSASYIIYLVSLTYILCRRARYYCHRSVLCRRARCYCHRSVLCRRARCYCHRCVMWLRSSIC